MKSARLLLSAVVPLLLLACGDDGGSSGPSKADRTVSTFDKLPVCSESREGETAYVKDEDAVYVCESGAWTAGGSGGSSQKPGSSADQGSSGSGSNGGGKSSGNGGGNSSGPNSSSSQQGGEDEIPCANLWCAARGDTALVLPLPDGDVTTYWFASDDSADNGASSITLAEGGIAESIRARGAISFTYALSDAYAYPYVLLGFGMGPDGTADISAWSGICLTYSASAPFKVQIAAPRAIVNDFNHYTAAADSSTETVTLDLPWSAFEQADWGGDSVDRNEVLQNVERIQITLTGAGGDSGAVELFEVGTLGTCGQEME
ncbi:MAG: hypothetical protein J6T45_01250 [Fibrobacterales bacterium]|nr:hypothetical protein [Fibrobacterales bacterium]